MSRNAWRTSTLQAARRKSSHGTWNSWSGRKQSFPENGETQCRRPPFLDKSDNTDQRSRWFGINNFVNYRQGSIIIVYYKKLMIEFSFTIYIIDPRETFSEISLLREEIKHISDSNTCMFLKCYSQGLQRFVPSYRMLCGQPVFLNIKSRKS